MKKCPWGQHQCRGQGRKQGETQDRPNSSLSQHPGKLWIQNDSPSCPKLDQGLLPLASGKRWDLRQGGFLWLKQYLKGLPAEGYLLAVLPASGATDPSLKGDLGNTSRSPYAAAIEHCKQTNKKEQGLEIRDVRIRKVKKLSFAVNKTV